MAATSEGIPGATFQTFVAGKQKIIREAAITIDADDRHLTADMTLPGAAEETVAATDMPFTRDDVAGFDIRYGGADLLDYSHEFMADDQWRPQPVGCPFVPTVDMDVRATNACLLDSNDDVVLGTSRARPFLQRQAASRTLLDQSVHHSGHLEDRPNAPGYKLFMTEDFRAGTLAGSDAQDRIEDFSANLPDVRVAVGDASGVDIHVVAHSLISE